MRPLIIGNWKMHGLAAQLEGIQALSNAMKARPSHADVLICPPFTLIERSVRVAAGLISIGAQNCHHEAFGACTGDVSAEMLKDSGASAVIVGHSERRRQHGETSAVVAAKAHAAVRAGLQAIICIGETQAQRAAGMSLKVCGEQLAQSLPQGIDASACVIGYEPLWAIGSGHVPGADLIGAMHGHIRLCLLSMLGLAGQGVRILYGGSVTQDNADQFLALCEVGGLLIGGASLDPVEFEAIVRVVKS